MRAPHYGHALSRTSLVKVSIHHVFITFVVSVLHLALGPLRQIHVQLAHGHAVDLPQAADFMNDALYSPMDNIPKMC